MGDRDDPDDVMETSLTIDYDKQWLNCVSAIGPLYLIICTCKYRVLQITHVIVVDIVATCSVVPARISRAFVII